jgi:hypothetical protein
MGREVQPRTAARGRILPHSRGSTGTGAPAGTHQPVDARRHERNGHLSTSDPRVTSQSATDDWLITHRAGNARPEAGRVLQGLDEASGAPVDSVGRPRTPPWRPTPGRPRAGSSRASPRSREPQTRPRAILSVVHISPIRLSWTHTESMICVRYPCGASAGFSLLPRGRAHISTGLRISPRPTTESASASPTPLARSSCAWRDHRGGAGQ